MKYKGYRGKMHDLVKSGSVDETKLKTLIQERQQMVAEKIKLKVNMKQAIFNVLTPEQREKMEKMRQMMMKKHE